MKRISKRVREEAAQICAACASHGEPVSVTQATAWIYGIDTYVAVRSAVARLAVAAWGAAHDYSGRSFGADDLRDDYAEAEAMLRTGFTPEGWR